MTIISLLMNLWLGMLIGAGLYTNFPLSIQDGAPCPPVLLGFLVLGWCTFNLVTSYSKSESEN